MSYSILSQGHYGDLPGTLLNTCGVTAPALQVLFENLPVALAAVDCTGNETSIAECQNNDRLIGTCTNITSSTVLACANLDDGVMPAFPLCGSSVCMVRRILELWSKKIVAIMAHRPRCSH